MICSVPTGSTRRCEGTGYSCQAGTDKEEEEKMQMSLLPGRKVGTYRSAPEQIRPTALGVCSFAMLLNRIT